MLSRVGKLGTYSVLRGVLVFGVDFFHPMTTMRGKDEISNGLYCVQTFVFGTL